MSDFISDEEMKKIVDSSPDFIPDDTPEAKEYETPGLARRLYEQNVVIPARALRHFAPNPETLQEKVLDPAIGYFTGESPEQRKMSREDYSRYLEKTYPVPTKVYETLGALGGGFAKGSLAAVNPLMAVQQATEPLAEQAINRPESLDFNLETGLGAANLVVPAALSAPKYATKGLATLKTKPGPVRQSLMSYAEDPLKYDAVEAVTGGNPYGKLIEDVSTNLSGIEAKRAQQIADLRAETKFLSQEDKRQVARNIATIRDQTKLGTYEGDKMINAVNALSDKYKETAQVRNKILEQTNGQMDPQPLYKLVNDAERSVILPEHKANIRALNEEIASIVGDKGYISPTEINALREKLQKSVSWGGHSQPWETQYKKLASQFNEILDMSIPGNNPLRNQIREETIRYNMANDLFGGDFPLKKFEAATKDPMKRRELENLDIPEVSEILKTIDYRNSFEANLKLGQKPKSDVVGEYIAKKKQLEELEAQKLPFSSNKTESELRAYMLEDPRNPRYQQNKNLQAYGEQYHPEGAGDFTRRLEESRVMRDVEGINFSEGSRFTNLGKAAGGAVGSALSYLSGNDVISPQTGLWAGAGALGGAYLDKNASTMFRSSARGAKAMEPVSQAYYPYAGMSRQQTIEHYLRSSRDPEYAQSIEDEKKMREGRQ
jgi:hypothetical protein